MMHSVGAQPLTSDIVEAPNSAGCIYDGGWSGSMWSGAQDIKSIPLTDYYGNKTTGYTPVNAYRNGGIDPSDPLSVSAAAFNAADDAGLRIRKGVPAGGGLPGIPNVTVFALGLGTSGIAGADALLLRISNDPASSSYDSLQATGLYTIAPTKDDLTDAFNKIASEIVRLAQ